MTLWIATNSYRGDGAIAVIVEARNVHDARHEATLVFRAETSMATHQPDYGEDLTVERIDLPIVCEINLRKVSPYGPRALFHRNP